MKTKTIKRRNSKSFDKALIHLGIHYPIKPVAIKKA
jgi:hypothetical protein